MMDGKDVKQVIVIRKDLGMRRGKEIAQGAHASIAWLTNRASQRVFAENEHTVDTMVQFSRAEWKWIQGGFRKICCVVNSEQELFDLHTKAWEHGVRCELIQDSGLTEFGGVATYTTAAFGPDYDEKLDPITGDLVLY